MQIEALLKTHREEILVIAQQHGASNVRVFGSVALGRSLLDLEALLGRKVDVVNARGLRPHLRHKL